MVQSTGGDKKAGKGAGRVATNAFFSLENGTEQKESPSAGEADGDKRRDEQRLPSAG